MNYFEIGQRIRKYRKALNLSQEELAEKAGISTTHMSHIETGNTKLSLPVLVSLALILEVRTDDLLFDANTRNKSSVTEEILELMDGCTAEQLKILYDILKATTVSLNKHL